MKHLPCVLLLSFLASCKALGAALQSEEDAAIDRQAQQIGNAAGDTVGLVTGNPVLDLGVTALVAAGAGFYLRLKRKPKAAPAA